MVKESKRGLTKWWMRSAKRHQVDGAPFLCIYLPFLANGFIRRCNLQPAACLDVASNKTHHRARPRGPVSRLACPCLAIILEIISIPMSRLFLRGEIQQHVVVRILRDVGNGITFILV